MPIKITEEEWVPAQEKFETGEDFRSFRPDRIHGLDISGETFVDAPPRDLSTYVETLRQCRGSDF